MTADDRPVALKNNGLSNSNSSSNNNNNNNNNNYSATNNNGTSGYGGFNSATSAGAIGGKLTHKQVQQVSQWRTAQLERQRRQAAVTAAAPAACESVTSPAAATVTPVAAWCQACVQPISDRFFLQVGDCLYHGACLRCQQCQQCLEADNSCYARDGKIFCREDYFRLFSTRQLCTRCGGGLHPSDLVMKARGFQFHLACFTCHSPHCQRRFSPGDEFGLSQGGAVFCRQHLRDTAHQLPGSHPQSLQQLQPFADADSCAAVTAAADLLAEAPAGGKQQQQRTSKGRPRKSAAAKKAASAASLLLPSESQPPQLEAPMPPQPLPQELQHHLHHLQLHQHHHAFPPSAPTCVGSVKEEPMLAVVAPHPESDDGGVGMDLELGSAFGIGGGDSIDQSGPDMSTDACCLSPSSAAEGGGCGGSSGCGGGGEATTPAPGQRQKRVRTSFKHHQLRTMKSYFIINHNPDSKDLKQLAQKTGLSKRVLQVWFQNARAKYRRSLLKQQQGQQPPDGDPAAALAAGMQDTLAACQKAASLRCHASMSPDLSDLSSTGSAPEFSQSALADGLLIGGGGGGGGGIVVVPGMDSSNLAASTAGPTAASSGGAGAASQGGGDYFAAVHNVNCLA